MVDLTQNRLRTLLDYDPDTGVFTWRVNRGHVKVGDVAGSKSQCLKTCYILIAVDRQLWKAHRLAFLWMTGQTPEHDVDHINGNGADNRWCNLRSVTHRENAMNRGLQRNNTSGHCGVVWLTNVKKWRAQIKVCGKVIRLGCYEDKNEAIDARKKAEYRFGFHPNHGKDRSDSQMETTQDEI